MYVLSPFILPKSTPVILDVIVPIGLMEYVSVNCFVDFSLTVVKRRGDYIIETNMNPL